jgi:hypothetical protein
MTTTDTTLQGNKANNSNTNSPDGNTDMPDIYKDFDFAGGDKPTKISNLWRKGVLVQIQGGVWSMETRLTADDLNMGVNQIPGFATLGKKRLLDPKYKNQFLNIVGKARAAAERLGFGFVLTGSYFVPFGNFDRLKEVIDKQQNTFDSMVDRFINGYTERRAEFLEKYAEHWEKLDPYYPSPEYVRSKFSMKAIYYVASMSGSLSGADGADDMYLQWAMDSMNGLRLEARDVADTIRKATDDGKLDGRTMRRVQTLIDRLENMDMLEDTTLRNAALALAEDATAGNADALTKAATDVDMSKVRAILLD